MLFLAATLLSSTPAAEANDVPHRKHFVSTSLFMIANLLPNPPSFVQANFGTRLTKRDVLIVEAITWTYDAPLGIPWGPEKGAPTNAFPGFARDVGVGLAYQRFWWEGLFTTIHATPFLQTYHDEDGKRLATGFQLFLTARLGWRFDLFRKRLFIEPSIAATAWPINTNLPRAFQREEDRWPGYFLAEPGLNVGVQF
ncbi:MAG: hypothetical protein AAGA48_30460 [Myxococcota bacterium]